MLSKALITLATLIYGVAPLVADLNATHALNPDWTPHARVHLVWMLGTNFCIAATALWLLWFRNRQILAAALGLCVMAGFWIAVTTRSLYGGALSDFDVSGGKSIFTEGNVLVFGVVVLLLAAGILLKLLRDDI